MTLTFQGQIENHLEKSKMLSKIDFQGQCQGHGRLQRQNLDRSM
jgi:hypothetical protein